MGVRERYEQRQKEGKSSDYSGVKQRYMAKEIENVGSSITNRVNTWLKNHNTYISNYQTRNSGRKYNYEDSYVSDSADWLNTVSQQKSAFDSEADSILSYMDQYKDYLNADWMAQVRKTLTDARGAQDIVLGNTRKDNEWWSSFGSEEMLKAHGSAEEAYKANQRYDGYSKKYSGRKYEDIQKALKSFETNRSSEIAGMESDLSLYKELSRWEQDEKGEAKLAQLRQKYGTIKDLENAIYGKKMASPSEEEQWLTAYQDELYKGDSNYMSKAASGWKSYEAQKIAEWKEEESKTWFDKALESFATTPADTSLPNAGLINAQVAYTNDTTYREPNDEWSTEQKNRFGYLWTEDKQKAYAYAEQVNNQINAKKKYDQQQAIGAAASDNFWSGAGHTLGAIATAPMGIVDYLNDIAEYTARGTITQKEFISPFEYSQAVQSGIANKLNGVDENGVAQNVLDENIPIFGGKGWGDIYSLGVSTANSMLSALAFGGAGTLVNFIGQGGAAGVDDALSRGATAEQALLYGTIVGSLEGLTEMIPAEQLIKAGSSATFKNWLKKALQQGAGEFFEEGASSFFGNLADDIIMRDKSNYNLMVKQLMQSNPGMTAEEASKIAFKQMAGDIAYDAIGGAVSGFASGGITGAVATAIDSSNLLNKENVKAKQQYGGSTDALIQEGLQNNPNSESYQLAQKYQKQVEGKKSKDGKEVKKGKELSGFQIRNLLAANHEQTVEQTKSRAKDRLKELGENASEIYTIADIVTKKVYGQELTRSEKSTLANSFGSQVAKEIDDERKLVAALVQAAKESSTAHKSLTDRVGEESNLSVSESGQTTIRGTDEAFDIKKAEVATLADGRLTFKTADGNEVSAEDIDWADEDTAYLVSAVSRIENITPGDATVLIHNYDASSDMSVGEYVNGIDEAFTYGYNNYSVEDMKAGRFTTKLSDQQMMSAYKLGQTERNVSKTAKVEAIKKMRTAVDAEVEKLIAEGKTVSKGKMTITYNAGNGKVVDFDQAGMKLSTKQKAAPALAKVMHEMGLGTNFELFSSYLSETMKDEDGNRVRVFLNEKGEEEVAYSGVYRMEDGTVRIDLNAYNGRGLTLDAMSHELTHFIQQWSGEKYEILADFLVKTYEKTDMSMHQRVLREQARLERIRKKDVSYSEAYDEVVANAMSKMLADGKVMERIQELKAQDMDLAQKLWEGLKKLLKKFFRAYEKESALFYDAADLMELKEEFEQMQKMWAEAFVEASENFQASLTAAENQILTEAGIGFDESTKSVYSLHFSNAFTEQIQVGKKAFDAETIAQLVSKATGRSIEDAREWVKSEMAIANIVMQNPEFLDFEADNRYEAIKKNSDYPQGTVDLSNLCPKREEFTAMFDMLQKKYPNKLFTAQDIADMRKILSENDITVACGACFVEDRRQLIGEIADTFIGMWKEAAESGKPLQKTNAAGSKIDLLVTKALAKQYGLTAGTKIMAKDTYIPNQYDLTTYEGFKLLEKNHPTIAMAFNRYNNSRGQQSARLIEGRAEYKRQILGWSDAKVKSVNNNGGLRIFSFSDFEVVHLLDLVQVIIDCAAKGVKIQGYTKIPAFAKLVRGTGIKLNRSLIPKGDYGYHMENGKVVLDYDTTEGINIHDKNFMDESDNPNVGNIVIGINPTQISAAMLDPFIDYIIPFHSNKAKEILRKLGTGEWVNYKESQHEKDISTGKASKHNVNIYTEVINKYNPKNKVEFVEAFLKECKRQGKIPRYAEFLNVDANGDYAYREGYHKLLVDFKMFDKDGNILPQGNITPNLDEGFMKELLNAEIDKKQNYEFPKKVYDAIDKKFGERFSSQETDADYMDAVNRGDMKTAQKMVDEAAKKAGYITESYHGTADKFTVFGVGDIGFHSGTKEQAEARREYKDSNADSWNINRLYHNITNPIVVEYDIGDWSAHEVANHIIESRLIDDLTDEEIRWLQSIRYRDDNVAYGNQYNTSASEDLRSFLQKKGYDGIKYINSYEGSYEDWSYVAFDPNQYKSADPVTHDDSGNVIPLSERFNPENKDIRYSSQETDADYIKYDRKAILKESKVDEYLYDYAAKSSPKYAQAYIAYVRPRTFLKLTTDDMLERYHIADQAGELDAERLSNSRPGIYLRIDHETGKVTGHEGRHRMSAMDGAGIELVPVLLLDTSNKMTKTDIAEITLHGQFDETAIGVVRDLIPLNYENRDRVVKNFATQSSAQRIGERYGLNKTLRFSGHETDDVSNRHLLANAFEGISKSSIEYKMIQEYKGHIEELNKLDEKLSDLNEEIHKIRFDKETPRDSKKLKELQDEAKEVAKEINKHDKRLLNMEASEPLRKVIDRERAKARDDARQKNKAAMDRYRLKKEVKQSELMRDIRETKAALKNQKNETSIMEKEFIRIAKAYEKLDAKSTAKSDKDTKAIADLKTALKEESKKHRDDQKTWEAEFNRLMREYELADRSIDRLEEKIERQKQAAKNKVESRQKTELRHKIRKTIRDLDKILNRGNKKLNVKEDVQNVVTKALQAADILFTDNYGTYDMLRNGIGADLSDSEEALVKTCTRMLKDLDKMPTDGYDNFQARQEAERKLSYKMSNLKDVFARERKRLNSIKVSTILGELADAYASLEKSEQSYVQGAYTEAVHNFLKNLQSEVGGTIVKDMTKDQLEYVYAAYKMVLTTVRKANQMFNKELKMSREQLGNAVIQEVMNAGGVHGLWTKAELAASKADWNNMKPIWVANRIGSDTFGMLMKGLFEGQYNFAVDVEEAKQFKLSMDEKYKPRSWDAEKLYEFESSTGKAFSLNLQQIMSLYAFSKREQAYSHLLNGGFVFEGNSTVIVDENGRKKTYIHNGATSYKLNEATLNDIISSLTKEQKAYVDEMQKYLSEVMGAKGNEVSMQLYGIKMFKEQFYFPLRSSGAYMERAKEAEMKKQQGQINLVNSGFTHAVKPEAKNPIILSGFMDVWAEHCNEMSMYHSMVLPMEDFRKVYNYSTVHDDKVDSASVYQTIQDAYGDAATAYIDQLYRELNAGATIDPRETTFKKLISNFKKTAVMLSASVVVQQFSSIGRAYALIDPKYFIGTRVNSDTQLSVAEEMRKYAPVAIIKEMGGFDTGTKGSAKSYIMAEKYGKGEWLQGLKKDEQYRSDLMGILPAKADEKTWCAIWEAVKRETKAKYPKMDVKSEEFLKLAGDRFSEVIEKTQVYDSVLARSANMRSKTGLMQMATSFMAEPTTTVNLLEDAIRRGDKKHMARAFGAVAVSIVLNNALASIVYAMRDDDEDETFIEKYFQSFTSGMIDDINPMSYYPFLKDVYSLFQGYDVERADMSVIADLRDALKKAISLIGKDTSGMDDDELAKHYRTVNSAILSLLDAGCSVFGVPLKNVRRDANGIINAWNTVGKDLTERDTSWNSFWDKVGAAAKDTIPIYAWTKDEPKQDKLYEAIVSGDKAYLARLKSTYKTDSAYQSAVRKALRENDSRIHEAAQAKYEGRTEEYKRIFREIQKEGKFSFDDIMSAVNSEESAIRNKLEPDKATSSYTASYFVESIVLGDSKSAETMKEDIIATKVANGKTQAEAEKEFISSVATGIRDAYSSGLLDEAGAEKMLMEYADKDEEEAASKVGYWGFCEDNPKYDYFTESNVKDYREFAEPENISLEVYAQFINGTKGLADIKDKWGDVEVTKREQVLEVIDSLPLTWQQKDALYLAAGYSESKIWDVPW